MSLDQLIPWRVSPQVLADWCAYQIQHNGKAASYCSAILRMIAHKKWPVATKDAYGTACDLGSELGETLGETVGVPIVWDEN
jgi:hypothetical protein